MVDLNKYGIINYLLLPFSIFYFLASFKKFFYQIGWFAVHSFDIPIIVVGNITVGGSGKTPIVITLVNFFKQQGMRVGVVSRGYGGSHNKNSLLVDNNTSHHKSGDEPLLIASETKVPVMVNKNRAQAVKDLIANFDINLIISDDGMQHYAMGRSVEIAVIDGKYRLGNGFFIPAGPLREPKSRLKSVDFIINNGCLCSGEIYSTLVAKKFINMVSGEHKPLTFFNNQNCYAIAGIGHPQRFFDFLLKLNIKIQSRAFPDHYAYAKNDLHFAGEHPLIMTAKDYIKCSKFATNNMWYLQVEAELDEHFFKQLKAKL